MPVFIQPFVFDLFPNAVGRLQALDSHGEELPVIWRTGFSLNVGVSPDGTIKSGPGSGSGFVYATTQQGREQTFASCLLTEPTNIQSLELPPTTRVTIGTSSTTLVTAPQKPATYQWTRYSPAATSWVESLRRLPSGEFEGEIQTLPQPPEKATFRYQTGEGFIRVNP